MNKRIVSFFFLLLFTGSIYAAIGITDLRTEQLKNPAGIDVRQPRLSWRIESDEQNVIQTAYHILVASSPELLEQGKGDIWDSGKIESSGLARTMDRLGQGRSRRQRNTMEPFGSPLSP